VTVQFALQLMGDMLLTALLVAAPVLLPVMLVGLVISVFQVVTQVQEISLTFVPKIITVFVTLVLFGPWMLHKLLAFSTAVIVRAGSL
jgi:flagellar biosynthetic protein FliQ